MPSACRNSSIWNLQKLDKHSIILQSTENGWWHSQVVLCRPHPSHDISWFIIMLSCFHSNGHIVGVTYSDKLQYISGWWFGTSILFSHILGISSSQLTNAYFPEGFKQPPTRFGWCWLYIRYHSILSFYHSMIRLFFSIIASGIIPPEIPI